MPKSHPVFHIYLPNTLTEKLMSMSKCKYPGRCRLIGLWERCTTELLSSHKFDNVVSVARSVGTVIITIVGISFKKHLSDENFNHNSRSRSQLQFLGEVIPPGKNSRFSNESVELPPLWITLGLNKNNNVILEQIYLDNVMLIPEPQSIVVLEYNPNTLKYCVGIQNTGVPDIVLDGFNLVAKLPVDVLGLLLPAIDENRSLLKDNQSNDYPAIKQPKYISKVLNRSLGLTQIVQKLWLISQIFRCKPEWMRLSNIIGVLLLDTFLGIVLTSYLLQFPNLFSTLHLKIETLLKLLMQLLQWLRGSPAGLKLNSALNSLLWRFFSYHLHLWGNYIGILEPMLSFILATLIRFGFLGVTIQIALVKDLLSISTFHIYCLYIYATRLFSVQLTVLKSLGRLFFGRKWNPLRNRVDSVQLSNSEMFISSLAFTIAVFLAPTTIIYYVVFLMLRLPVLLMENVLNFIVDALNTLEITTAGLVLVNSPRVADGIYLKPVTKDNILTFEIRTLSTKKMFQLPNVKQGIGVVLRSIVQGKLLS